MRTARSLLVGCCGTAVALVALGGCSAGPAVEPDHQRLLASLRTAISARNAAWLQQNVELIAAEHEQKKMSDEVRAAFDEVVALAQDQQWQEAEARLLAWQMDQTPTVGQQARVANRELPEHVHVETGRSAAAHAVMGRADLVHDHARP